MDKEIETTINRLLADKKMAVDLADYLIKENVKLREALKKTVEVCDVVLNKEFNWAVKMTLMKENVALARAALKEHE